MITSSRNLEQADPVLCLSPVLDIHRVPRCPTLPAHPCLCAPSPEEWQQHELKEGDGCGAEQLAPTWSRCFQKHLKIR